jgi:hypothetical protein
MLLCLLGVAHAGQVWLTLEMTGPKGHARFHVPAAFEPGNEAMLKTAEGEVDLRAVALELGAQPVGASKTYTVGERGTVTLIHEESTGRVATELAVSGKTPAGKSVDAAVAIDAKKIDKATKKMAIDRGPISIDLGGDAVVAVLAAWEPTTLVTLEGEAANLTIVTR